MTEPLDLPRPDADDRSARAAALRSRAAVHARDREAWLSIFAPDAVVQDPVGVSPLDESGEGHRGIDAIAEFWDTVIAPNPVHMDILASYAGGNEVANVMTITTTFPDGATATVDLVGIYRVNDEGRVAAMRAFWEFDKVRFTSA